MCATCGIDLDSEDVYWCSAECHTKYYKERNLELITFTNQRIRETQGRQLDMGW